MRETASVYKAELHWAGFVHEVPEEHQDDAKEILEQIEQLRKDMEPDKYFGQ